MASAELPSRQGGGSPDPAIVATARTEGPGGNALSVQVSDASRLQDQLARLLPTRNISAQAADTLTVDDATGYAGGEVVTLEGGGNSEPGVVASVSGGNTIVLAAAPANDYTNGTIGPAGALAFRRAEANIASVSGDRTSIGVDALGGLAPGDRILLDDGGGNTATVIVRTTQGATTINLTAPIPGNTDFTGGTVRTADLTPGQRSFRLAVPAALSLNQGLPAGSVVSITQGGTGEIGTVASSGGDAVTLADGVTNAYDLSDPADLPVVVSLEFSLAVTDGGTGATETFGPLSTNPKHPSYWGTTATSELVGLSAPSQPPSPAPDDPRPVAGVYNLANGTADDRAAAATGLINDPTSSLDLLKPLQDVSMVVVPGVTDTGVQAAVVAHCEAQYDRFAILDPVPEADIEGIQDQFAMVRSAKGFAALYYPWITVRNPATGATELWPPSGHLAGIYARTDQSRGVHKAPANTNIRGALGVERRLTNEEQGPLNLMGINVLRVFPGQGQPLVWGARTTAGDLDRNWQYVNIRRLFIFLEQSIERGIRWAVFEPNDLALWQKLKRTHHGLPDPGLAGRGAVRREGRGGLLRPDRRGAQPAVDPGARAALHRDRRGPDLPGRVHRPAHRHLGRRRPRSASRRRASEQAKGGTPWRPASGSIRTATSTSWSRSTGSPGRPSRT